MKEKIQVPYRPLKPWKPTPPNPKIKKNSIYSISSFEDLIHPLIYTFGKDCKLSDLLDKKITLDAELDYGSCYYESERPEISTTITIGAEDIDNPNFSSETEHYKKAMEDFGAKEVQYKEDMKEYRLNYNKFKSQLEARERANKERTVAVKARKNK